MPVISTSATVMTIDGSFSGNRVFRFTKEK